MKLRWVRVLGIALVLCLVSVGVLSAEGPEHHQFPIEGEMHGYCGESMYWDGSCHLAVDGDPCGATDRGTWSVRVHCLGEAVSLDDGSQYKFIMANLDKGIVECEPDEGLGHRTITIHDTVRYISQGPQPNLLAKMRIHFTSNANGEWTAEFETVDCKVVWREE